MKRKAIAIGTLVFSLVLVTGLILSAQNAMARPQAQYVEKGRKLFNQYCATCHGATAKGEGPVAAALKVGPPDLTAIQQAGEKFPFYRVQTKIDGEKEVTAHGPSKMPVWGTVFKRTSGELQRHADVYALVKYIESIQRSK
ncbi:MAG TPA: c-type cytochrome [Blastocatellia bacterium]|nr:c-type cytochrome [Blastocatellia bacterium]